jgi:uncharacterized lipoprotein YmbA
MSPFIFPARLFKSLPSTKLGAGWGKALKGRFWAQWRGNDAANLKRTVALVLTGLSLSGCSTLSARPDPSRFFTLTPLPQAEQSAGTDASNAGGISLGIGPIKFPGYLDRQEIVTRVAQNRIDLSETDQWAEPLEENFARVLSQNISGLLRGERIITYPWPIDKRPDYQVEIEVLRFEANAAQDVQLSARWSIMEANRKNLIQYRESRLARPAKAKSTEASVAALSEALGDLSREIADAIGAIDGRGK